jgi:hypothetical protein
MSLRGPFAPVPVGSPLGRGASRAGWLAAALLLGALPTGAPAQPASASASASASAPTATPAPAPGADPAGMAPAVPPALATRFVVYFNRLAVAGEPAAECDSVRAVPRSVPRTPAVAGAALRALFAGPSAPEQAAGWRSPFSAATAGLLRSVRLVQGTAYVDLADHPTLWARAGASCSAAELLVAIERTLRQFPSVRRVVIAVEGDPRRFYDAIGLRCDASNDHCSPRPFQAPGARR